MFLSLPPQPDHSWKNMNPMDHEILLETIVAITEQRDQHSLELSLLASLNEMLQPSVCFLLDLPSGASDRQRKTASGASMELPEEIVELAGTIPEYQFVKAHSGDLIYLLTVIVSGKDEQRRVLFVGMPGWNETAERLLVGMVRVYQNFMKLMSESEIDTLTGLQNRRKLESFLTSRLSARLHQRRESDMQIGSSSTLEKGEYLAVLDLDRFKRINDTFGHLIGDEVLLTFSSILRASLRDNDRSFRYGGEEFIVVLSAQGSSRLNTAPPSLLRRNSPVLPRLTWVRAISLANCRPSPVPPAVCGLSSFRCSGCVRESHPNRRARSSSACPPRHPASIQIWMRA
jgi:diguanylate cyclase (GGDEF)-like protein